MTRPTSKRRRAQLVVGLLPLFLALRPALAETPPEAVDPVESVESLRAAELAFAAAARDRDRDAFASFVADDAIFVDTAAHNGKTAALEAWAPFFRDGEAQIEWSPEIVEVQAGGKLGLTRGSYSVTFGADGAREPMSGVFTSVWRREPEGDWKLIFDIGCPPCALPAASPENVDLKLRIAAGTMNHRFLSYETCTPEGCSNESHLQWFKTDWDPELDDETVMPERVVLATCPLPELTGESEILSARWKTASGADPRLSVLVSPPTRDPEDYELLLSPARPCDYTVTRTLVVDE